jgi:hypothetical protein
VPSSANCSHSSCRRNSSMIKATCMPMRPARLMHCRLEQSCFSATCFRSVSFAFARIMLSQIYVAIPAIRRILISTRPLPGSSRKSRHSGHCTGATLNVAVDECAQEEQQEWQRLLTPGRHSRQVDPHVCSQSGKRSKCCNRGTIRSTGNLQQHACHHGADYSERTCVAVLRMQGCRRRAPETVQFPKQSAPGCAAGC